MLSGREATQWFIYHNPELASGYIDENIKINKLLYFSNLMYQCIHNTSLIKEDFVAFPKGPVVYSVYRDYRYNGLSSFPRQVPVVSEEELKVLNIINFVYGNSSTDELIEESHTHSLWAKVKHLIPNNPKIDFASIEPELREYYWMIYQTYCDYDFSKIVKEKINNNIYFYDKSTFDMSDDVIELLSHFEEYDEPRFLEMIDGELVVS